MSDDNADLIKDITKARAWVKQTRRELENAKLHAKEAKEIHEGAISSLDELVAELTGESKRPLFEGISNAPESECEDPDNPDCDDDDIDDRIHAVEALQGGVERLIPGPLNQTDALILATALPSVRDAISTLVAEGGDNDAIHRALIQWSSHKWAPARADQGNAWAVRGGSIPAFWYDSDVSGWPGPGKHTLVAGDLIKAVRKALHIPVKKAKKAKPSPEPAHQHTRACYDDPGPGHGAPQLICGETGSEPAKAKKTKKAS